MNFDESMAVFVVKFESFSWIIIATWCVVHLRIDIVLLNQHLIYFIFFDPITRTNCLRGHPSIEIYDQLLQSNLIKSTKYVFLFYSLQMQSMTFIDGYSIGHTPISLHISKFYPSITWFGANKEISMQMYHLASRMKWMIVWLTPV